MALVCGLPVTVKKIRHDCGLTEVLTVFLWFDRVFCDLTVFFCGLWFDPWFSLHLAVVTGGFSILTNLTPLSATV